MLSEFRARVGDQVANFYQREARTPVSLPWLPGKDGKPTNLTLLMQMQRDAPALRSLVDKSLGTAKEWAQADVTEAEREAAAAVSRAATAKTLLATK